MRGLTLESYFAAIDEANSLDPHLIDWHGDSQPRARLQGVLASAWLERLTTDAPAAVQVAARAHHLERWIIPRESYPQGRGPYLRWRSALKRHHAQALARVLTPLGIDPDVLARAQALVQRQGLGQDPDTQLVEDVACLVFLETDFEALADRLDHDRLVNAVQKTLNKMSGAALALSEQAELSAPARAALASAIAG